VINAFSSTLSEVSQMRAEANLDDGEIRQGIEELAIQIEHERTKLLNLDDSLGKNRSGTTFLLSRKTDSSRQINAATRIIQEINESNIEGIKSVTGSQVLDQESETNRRRFAASSRNLVRKMLLVKERAALLEETNNHPANGQNLLLQRVLDLYRRSKDFEKVSLRITRNIDLVSEKVPFRSRAKRTGGRSTYRLDDSPLKSPKGRNKLRPIDIENRRKSLTMRQMKPYKSSVSHWRNIESSLQQIGNENVKIDRFNTLSIISTTDQVSQDRKREIGQHKIASRSLLMSPSTKTPTNRTQEQSLTVSKRVSIFSPPATPKARSGWDQPSTVDVNRVARLSLDAPLELKQTTLPNSSRDTLASFGTTPEKLKAAIDIKRNESTSLPVSIVKARSKGGQTKRSTAETAALPPLSLKSSSNLSSNPTGEKRETVISMPSAKNSAQKLTPSSAPLPPMPKQAPKNPFSKSSTPLTTAVKSKPTETKSASFSSTEKIAAKEKEASSTPFGSMKGLGEHLFSSGSSKTDAQQMPSFGALKSVPPLKPTETSDAKNYKAILTSFYQKYNSPKLGEVDKTLEKYKGREPEMFQKLSSKYKVPNPLQESLTPSSYAPTTTTGDSSSSMGFGNTGSTPVVAAPTASSGFGNTGSKLVSLPFSSSSTTTQQNSKVSVAPFGNSGTNSSPFGTVAGNNTAPKSSMFGTPAQSPFGGTNRQTAPTPFGGSQAPALSPFGNTSSGTNSTTPFGATGGLSSASPFGSAAAPTQFGVPSPSPVQPNSQRLFNGKSARDLLYQFYQEKNPSKLAEVDKVLAKYSGQEEQMFRNLAKKYQLDPSVFGISTAAPILGFGSPGAKPGFGQTSTMGGGASSFAQGPRGFGQPSPLGGGMSSPNPSGTGATFGSAATSGYSASGFGSLAQSPNPSPFGGQSSGFGVASPAFGSTTPFGAPRR